MLDGSRGQPEGSLSNISDTEVLGKALLLFWIATLNPEPYLLIIKREGIEYHFFGLWYGSAENWTLVSRIIGEYSFYKYFSHRYLVSSITIWF